jgi:hypothetical protein
MLEKRSAQAALDVWARCGTMKAAAAAAGATAQPSTGRQGAAASRGPRATTDGSRAASMAPYIDRHGLLGSRSQRGRVTGLSGIEHAPERVGVRDLVLGRDAITCALSAVCWASTAAAGSSSTGSDTAASAAS